jgi:hypothetical protein
MNPFGLTFDSAQNLILFKTALDKLYAEEKLEMATAARAFATDEVIFTQDSADKAAVTSSVLGGGGYFEKFTTDVTRQNKVAISAAAMRTTIIAKFKKDVPVSQDAMEDQQQDAVSKTVREQTKTWLATQDRNAVAVFNGAFTGATANSITIDGANLISNTHTNENGDTIDNYETGVLTDANVNINVVALRGQVNQAGVIVGYEPRAMFCSSTLHHDAMTVTKSVLKAGGGDNDLNYYSELYPGLQVKMSPFVDSSSTTSFFLMGSGHGVIRFERKALTTTLVPWQTDQDDNFIYKMRAREEVDAIYYNAMQGSDGTV